MAAAKASYGFDDCYVIMYGYYADHARHFQSRLRSLIYLCPDPLLILRVMYIIALTVSLLVESNLLIAKGGSYDNIHKLMLHKKV